MGKIDRAARFLRELAREDLAAVISFSTYQYIEEESTWMNYSTWVIELTSPKIYTEAIAGLPDWDQKRIAESINNTDQTEQSATRLVLKSNNSQIEDTLFPDIIIHRNQLVSIATGRGRIRDVDDYYKARQHRIAAGLEARGLQNPNPFESLWDWYRRYKSDFASYSERRNFINTMYAPLIAKVLHAPEAAVPRREPTGWERVDRGVEKARARMESARDEEDYQTVGLLCREVLISLGQAVYDPALHSSPDGVTPSATDAGRMIEAFLAQAAEGRSYENVRRHAKAALQLGVELQHKRTADFRAAALCLEATSSLTNIVNILSGRRDPMDDLERILDEDSGESTQ
jgi:hypothetical protein